MHDVPVIVRELSDADVLEIALIENIQRADLNPIEEAAGYQALISEFAYTQEQLSKAVGKSRSHVANMMRLLNLPESVQDSLRQGDITMGHARALLSADNPVALAREVIEKGLNVRATENLARGDAPAKPKAARLASDDPATEPDADTRALQDDIAAALGMRVAIRHRGEAGQLTIDYKTLEQLDEICRRLCNTARAESAA